MNQAKILCTQTQQTLFQILLQDPQSHEALYLKAKEFEDMGIDVEIDIPTIGESLILSLGANQEDLKRYRDSEEFECCQHDD